MKAGEFKKIEITVDDEGNTDLSKIPNCFVPDWFSKSNIEFEHNVILSDEEFQFLVGYLEITPVSVEVSQAVWPFVEDAIHELKIGKKGKWR
jgi:hypothetical protein